jgi:hypothetical protein
MDPLIEKENLLVDYALWKEEMIVTIQTGVELYSHRMKLND